MKKFRKFFILKIALVSIFSSVYAKENVDYINPIIGASTSGRAAKAGHGLGKTFQILY